MLNIHIKREFKDEQQLIQGKELPANAIQFQEGDTLQSAFRLGFGKN